MYRLADPTVRAWIEGDFRESLISDTFIKKHAVHMAIACDDGASPEEAIRAMVAAMVLDVAGMPANEEFN